MSGKHTNFCSVPVCRNVAYRKKIKHNIRVDNSSWEKKVTVEDAIVYMFDRPGLNFPLVAPGQQIPPPPTAPRHSRNAPAPVTPRTPRTTQQPPTMPQGGAHGENDAETSSENEDARLLARTSSSPLPSYLSMLTSI